MVRTIKLIGILCVSLTAACGGQQTNPIVSRDAQSNACFTEVISPAIIETQIEHREISPGKFETHKRPTLIRERTVSRINLVCPEDQTSDFISSLQRAFQARNLYSGPITGTWTAQTKSALSSFQTARGITIDALALVTAQELGLAVTPVGTQ